MHPTQQLFELQEITIQDFHYCFSNLLQTICKTLGFPVENWYMAQWDRQNFKQDFFSFCVWFLGILEWFAEVLRPQNS